MTMEALSTELSEVKRLVRPSLLNRWVAHSNIITCRKRNRDIHYIVCSTGEVASQLLSMILKWEKESYDQHLSDR